MTTPQRSTLHWLVAVGAFLVTLANAIPLSALSIFTPFVTEDLGFAIGTYQLSYTFMAIASMATMPLAVG